MEGWRTRGKTAYSDIMSRICTVAAVVGLATPLVEARTLTLKYTHTFIF